MLNSILTGRQRIKWQVVPPIANTAVLVVPIQRIFLLDSIPEIYLIAVLLPVPEPPVIKKIKGSSI